MNKPIIFFDVDGVVADLGPEWMRRYNADYHDQLDYHEHVTSWHIHEHVKPECGHRIYEYLRAEDLYNFVQPVAGALAAVRELRQRGYRVVFATDASFNVPNHKLRWLRQHGFLPPLNMPSSPDYVEVHDKHLLRGLALLDDGPHNLAGFHGLRLLFHHRHNQDDETAKTYRMRGWEEILRLFAPLT